MTTSSGGADVSLYLGAGCTLAGRLVVSAGTRIATAEERNRLGYEKRARLPRPPWRPLSKDEKALLIRDAASWHHGCSAAVLRLHDSADDVLAQIAEFSGQTITGRTRGQWNKAVSNLLAQLRKICTLGEPLSVHGVTADLPNDLTVTVNRDIQCRIGLHVDNWDGLPPGRRGESTNRICINVGSADRYFLFAPITLSRAAKLLSQEKGVDLSRYTRMTLLARAFMEHYPDFPVWRCRVGPAEAYIAPTENLIHDASTLGLRAGAKQITIRGLISPVGSPDCQIAN